MFYPISVINKHLNSELITYDDAKQRDFSGKNVILHCVWKLNCYNKWSSLPSRLEKEAKNLWIEFDADDNLTKLYAFDRSKDTPRFLTRLFKDNKKLIWEQSIDYNIFLDDKLLLPLRCYDTRFEKNLRSKDIDFFTVIEGSNNNLAESLELFTKLHSDGYKICFMLLNKQNYTYYKDKLDFDIITNDTKFSENSIKRFETLMDRSKVFIDLSYRHTTGRVVYDALYRGTIALATRYLWSFW